jgi:cobalt transporter subunit CbtB
VFTAITTGRIATGELVLVRRLPALSVLLIGLAIVYSVGFSSFARAHSAAHDTRHANGFPCH